MRKWFLRGGKAGVILLFLMGPFFAGVGCKPTAGPPAVGGHEAHKGAEETVKMWTCAMHPQIKLPKPGKCPICGMDLVPVKEEAPIKEGAKEGSPARLVMSEVGKALAEITTAPVERKFVTAHLRMVGIVDYDETRLAYITAWVPGRLDRLFVDFTGVEVKKGDHMVYIYSPEVRVAQEELLLALEADKNAQKSDIEVIRENARSSLEAARDKLRLWGLTSEQIAEIESQGKVSDHVTIYAPMSGIVIKKEGFPGMYVETGTQIYGIADLSQVWVRLQVYESDLPWVRYGQEVEFEAEASPGEKFVGRIGFVDPVLDPETRTVKLRVNVPNPDGRLKPQMYVRGMVMAQVAGEGKVMDPALAGKYICPMHPDVVEDDEGQCPICGMNLVTTESLGYVSAQPSEAPLVIPATAPLITGKRAVVYVEVPQAERPTYEGREVVLGPRAGDYYIVKEGLHEGENVVVRGNFKIDSALQIQAKPSMMSPEGGAPAPVHKH